MLTGEQCNEEELPKTSQILHVRLCVHSRINL